jgi:uncharacterized protein (UPF0297 family)
LSETNQNFIKMTENQYQEIMTMLTAIYKKLDKLERKVNQGGTLMASDSSYLEKLKVEAGKIRF